MKVYNNNSGSTGRKISTSKGNQLKFCVNNQWYKTDFLGYEGASEYFVSELLKHSNVDYFVNYDLTDIEYNGTKYNGCVSDNFLKENEMLVTLDKLFKMYTNNSIDNIKGSVEERIKKCVDEVESITGLTAFGPYLTILLELDQFTLNEDRHFKNIAVIKTETGFDYCPIFDNGAALLSDTREDYPIEKNIYGLIPTVEAKPFSKDFETQVNIARKLYGNQIYFNDFSPDYIYQHLNECYGEVIANRIRCVYEHQLYLLKDEYYKTENIKTTDDLEL